jgi:hypothetical protein
VPVLARAGAIVPMSLQDRENGAGLPETIQIVAFPGADNVLDLYEDDGESRAYEHGAWCSTPIEQSWQEDRLTLTIGPSEGDSSCLPAGRAYGVQVRGIARPDDVQATIDGASVASSATYDEASELLTIAPCALAPTSCLQVTLRKRQGSLAAIRDRRAETVRRYLRAFRLQTGVKAALDLALPSVLEDSMALSVFANDLTGAQLAALEDAVAGKVWQGWKPELVLA